jgi:ADP-ribose pyrophosphatase YjhB (NUDIX family)
MTTFISHSHSPDVSEHILAHAEDKYDGVIISSKNLPDQEDVFTFKLRRSLEHWSECNKRGVWLKLPLSKARFVPIAADMGFIYHHAEKDYVMMTHWLSEGENRLPANASHQVGVGSLVLNDEKKILLVQEKSGPLRGTGVWKIPTGLVEAGENLAVAAQREVEEETGIQTEFLKLLCFRHAHNILFGKSDLFFVCLLRAKTFDIVHQEEEIVASDWHHPETLFSQPFFQQSPLHVVLNQILHNEIQLFGSDNVVDTGLTAVELPIGFRPGLQTLYFPSNALPNERENNCINSGSTTVETTDFVEK